MNNQWRKATKKDFLLDQIEKNNQFLVEYVEVETIGNDEGIKLYDSLNERLIFEGVSPSEALHTLTFNETGYLYETYRNDNHLYSALQVYIIHDNMYFNLDNALRVQDGKDQITKEYIVAKPYEEIEEGSQCYHARYDSFDSAFDDCDYENDSL